MNDHVPYTYIVGWSKHNRYYYGVRYAKDCNPRDLWVSYFTSSKYVKEFRKIHGEPDILQIRKTFKNIESSQVWETKVLQRMRVINDDRFLNKGIGKSLQNFEIRKDIMIKKYGVENPSQLPGVSQKISESLKGKTKSEKHKQNMKKPKSLQGRKNIKESRISAMTLNPNKFSEICAKGGKSGKGKKKSSSHANKIANSLRKTYIIDDSIFVYNAKEYCALNNLNYTLFTQAAKNEKLYKGLSIKVKGK